MAFGRWRIHPESHMCSPTQDVIDYRKSLEEANKYLPHSYRLALAIIDRSRLQTFYLIL